MPLNSVGDADIIHIFQIPLNARKYGSDNKDIHIEGRKALQRTALIKHEGRCLRERKMGSRIKPGKVGFLAAIFVSVAAAAVTSGCTGTTDKMAVQTSASMISSYPRVAKDKDPALPVGKTKGTLPATAASKRALPANVPGERVTSASLTGGNYLGSAPYICTPSGFGRTSSCFLRGS